MGSLTIEYDYAADCGQVLTTTEAAMIDRMAQVTMVNIGLNARALTEHTQPQ